MLQNRRYATMISIELRRRLPATPLKLLSPAWMALPAAMTKNVPSRAKPSCASGPGNAFNFALALRPSRKELKCWYVESLRIAAAGVVADDSKNISDITTPSCFPSIDERNFQTRVLEHFWKPC